MHYGSKIIFGCTSSKVLAQKVCKILDSCKLGQLNLNRFSDGEIQIEIVENVRAADVFVICSTNPPAENFLELIFLASALRNSSAGRITLVIPYLGYNRQERKDQSRVPVSAKLVIEMIKLTRADRVLLLDLHADATAPHFEPMIVDRLYAAYTSVPYLEKVFNGGEFVVASPDAGGVPRARKYRQMLGSGHKPAIFSKERPAPGEVSRDEIMMVGDVKGKDVLFVDDMLDSGGTAVADAQKAREEGAKRIVFFATHGIFSGGAIKRIDESGVIDEVVITDSIQHDSKIFTNVKNTTFTVLSIDDLIAEAIRRLHNDERLSSLFLG